MVLAQSQAQLPPPSVFSLPEKFNKWRPGQEDAILHLQDSHKRVVIQVQPTGSGKSVCYMTGALLTGRTLILTSTKGLQRQLENDFPDHVAIVMGKNAYKCKFLLNVLSCEFGPCSFGQRCPVKDKCHYYQAIEIAKLSPIVVANYSFWISNKPDTLGTFDLLVCDEAHDTVTQLSDSLSIEITQKQVERTNMIPWVTSESELWRWVEHTFTELSIVIEKKLKSRPLSECLQSETFKAQHKLRSELKKLEDVDTAQWVEEYLGEKVTFDPLWPAEFAESYLFRGIPKILLTSATGTPKIITLLGLDTEEVDFKEYPSHFPIYNRPVLWVPTIRVDYHASPEMLKLWLIRIDQIIRPRLDRKGIIHAVSYERCQRILNNSEFAQYMITHQSKSRDRAIEEFKSSKPPTILVSPSVVTGYDFPYEECEYQIICKVPFPDQRRKVDKLRRERDPEFGVNLAAQNLVQALGRGMRAPDDQCEGFIIDDHMGWFVKKNVGLFPGSFLESYGKTQTLPQPLPKLRRR